jgi:hypothetical protein
MNQSIGKKPSPVLFGTIKVCLEGPFGIVLEKADDNPGQVVGVTAFVPLEEMPDMLRHQFFLGRGSRGRIGEDDGNTQFSLELDPHAVGEQGSLESSPIPRWVDTGFRDFNFVSDDWRKTLPNFVEVKLPCPDRILHSQQAVPVRFRSGRDGFMPMHHIFEYQVTHPNKGIRLTVQENQGQPQNFWLARGSDTFILQIGLVLGTPAGTALKHALHFYNEILLKRFPKLRDQALEHIGKPHHPLGLDVECHNGGGVVSYPG